MWEIRKVLSGEEQGLLEDGWEPFAVSPHDTSYEFYDTGRREYKTQHETTDYIYLRKQSK